jgi:hypothetical protein
MKSSQFKQSSLYKSLVKILRTVGCTSAEEKAAKIGWALFNGRGLLIVHHMCSEKSHKNFSAKKVRIWMKAFCYLGLLRLLTA